MKILNQLLLAVLIVPALIMIESSVSFASSEGYQKASQYMVAANRKKHPKQKQDRDVASVKKKKKTQKRKVASVKSKGKKKTKDRKVASAKSGKSKKKKSKKKKPKY